jgi:ATP-dependent Clp protease adaptor protein ClpS
MSALSLSLNAPLPASAMDTPWAVRSLSIPDDAWEEDSADWQDADGDESGSPGGNDGDDDKGNDDKGSDDKGGTTTGVVVKTRPKTKKPSMYKVLMLNDDYTPMEFVVLVLERFFNKNREEATRIMLHVHRRGVGVCGVFTYEVAETKVTEVMDFARQHQHPLQCTLEKD